MDCPHCFVISAPERLRCPVCGHDFDAATLEALGHLEFLIRWLQAWAREGVMGLSTRVLLTGLARAEIVALERELVPLTPAPEVEGFETQDVERTAPGLAFARWLYDKHVLRS